MTQSPVVKFKSMIHFKAEERRDGRGKTALNDWTLVWRAVNEINSCVSRRRWRETVAWNVLKQQMLLSAAVQQICRGGGCRGGGGGGGVSPVKVKIGRAIINSPSKSPNHCQISFAGLRCVRQPWHQQRLARSPRPLQMLHLLHLSRNTHHTAATHTQRTKTAGVLRKHNILGVRFACFWLLRSSLGCLIMLMLYGNSA